MFKDQSNFKVVGVIPARYKSTRFPGKPLVLILGKPMILHVAEKVEKALGKENTYIATDDNRIKSVVEKAGYNVIMTSENCLTGTDRLSEFSKKIEADIYVNIQGDEPMVDPKDIIKVVDIKKKNSDFVVNGMSNLLEGENPNNINLPKVLVNNENTLIYMSRLPIPGKKDIISDVTYKKQICIYAFNESELNAFGSVANKSPYEASEDIEILRFFDLNIPIKMVDVGAKTLAVDVPEDVLKVENELKKRI